MPRRHQDHRRDCVSCTNMACIWRPEKNQHVRSRKYKRFVELVSTVSRNIVALFDVDLRRMGTTVAVFVGRTWRSRLPVGDRRATLMHRPRHCATRRDAISVGKVSRGEIKPLIRSKRTAAAVFSAQPFNSKLDIGPALTHAEEKCRRGSEAVAKGRSNRGWVSAKRAGCGRPFTYARVSSTSMHDAPIFRRWIEIENNVVRGRQPDRIEIGRWDWHLLRSTSLLPSGHLFLLPVLVLRRLSSNGWCPRSSLDSRDTQNRSHLAVNLFFFWLLDWISSRRVEVHGIRKQPNSWHVNGRARARDI